MLALPTFRTPAISILFCGQSDLPMTSFIPPRFMAMYKRPVSRLHTSYRCERVRQENPPLSLGRRRVVLRGALLPTELAMLPRREYESFEA